MGDTSWDLVYIFVDFAENIGENGVRIQCFHRIGRGFCGIFHDFRGGRQAFFGDFLCIFGGGTGALGQVL